MKSLPGIASNWIIPPLDSIVIAVQYWSGDEARALRLARLIADIEPEPRTDVFVALARRFDMPELSPDAEDTFEIVRKKFPTVTLRSQRPGTGHPNGSNGLFAGAADALAWRWIAEGNGQPVAFFVEHDGCPLTADWIDVLRAEVQRAILNGKRVIGCVMRGGGVSAHVNGTLAMHLSMWLDRPSLHRTPDAESWDVFHRAAFLAEVQPTNLIRNIYGSSNWSAQALEALAMETVWMSSCKDDSVYEWARARLVGA